MLYTSKHMSPTCSVVTVWIGNEPYLNVRSICLQAELVGKSCVKFKGLLENDLRPRKNGPQKAGHTPVP